MFKWFDYFCLVKKSIAVFFLLIFCVSLPGFSVELHYCKGEVTDISFFGEAGCACKDSHKTMVEEPTGLTTCEKHCHKSDVRNQTENQVKKNKSCCKTEKLTFTSSKLKANSSTKVNTILAVLAVINPYAITHFFADNNPAYVVYLPPHITEDLLILNSVLII